MKECFRCKRKMEGNMPTGDFWVLDFKISEEKSVSVCASCIGGIILFVHDLMEKGENVKCHCSIPTLMYRGCRCGFLDKERHGENV